MNEGQFHSVGNTLAQELRKEVFRALAESSIYRDYARDFSRAIGLPVSLTPCESWQLAHQGLPQESPFCTAISQRSSACAACLRTQHKVALRAADSAQTAECVHGLYETAVPVRVGEHLIGFIRTGQAFRRTPTVEGFERMLERLRRWGVTLNATQLREAYFATRVVAPAQYRSAVGLLELLARQLSLLGNQLILQQAHAESPTITRAKEFIEAHYCEKLTLQEMAKTMHMSHCYFCKQFKQATGITFSRYLSRLRVEKAKRLLLNPHYRASEIAYAVGFASLNHFNRTFKRLAGRSPSAYRAQLDSWRHPPRPKEPSRRLDSPSRGRRGADIGRHGLFRRTPASNATASASDKPGSSSSKIHGFVSRLDAPGRAYELPVPVNRRVANRVWLRNDQSS